jgi:hypothetical protein
LIVLAVLAGCGGDESPEVASPPAGPMQIRGEGAKLAPGLYTYREFTPALRFTLKAGWEGGHLLPEFFDVFHPKAIVAFAHPSVLADADGALVSAGGLSPREALDLIAAHPRIDAEPLAEGEIDGHPASVLEFSAPEGEDLFGGTAGTFGASAEVRYRMYALDVADKLVLVLAQARGEPWGEGFKLADEVLETVRFRSS